MSDKVEKAEMTELREEARYWKRQAIKARESRIAARLRAEEVARPTVEIVRGETWWRLLVNGERIDGYETKDEADAIAVRLKKAFETK
jgi:hypothetical protein